MEVKSLRNLGHSCFMNSIIQSMFGIESVVNTLQVIERDLLLMSTLRKVHASRRTECMQRLETVLQSAMDKGRRGTARSTSVKLSRLLEMLPQIAIGTVGTPGGSMTEILAAVNLSFTEQLICLHAKLGDLTSSNLVNPMALYLSLLSHSSFEAFEQNDVSEFLFFLLDTVHAELVVARHGGIPFGLISFDDQFSSEFCDLFRGKHLGGNIFLQLHLDIPVLRLSVEHFLPPHGWRLVPPSVALCMRGVEISKAPQVLVLNLNRAEFSAGKASKNTVHVRVDSELDVGGFKYALAGVVVHQGGGSHGGHYSCFSKRKCDWYYLNDAIAELMGPIAAVLEELEKKAKIFQPCLLFYEKRNQSESTEIASLSILPRGSIG